MILDCDLRVTELTAEMLDLSNAPYSARIEEKKDPRSMLLLKEKGEMTSTISPLNCIA